MQPVFAYLDPATGTLILSAIVGGFAAIAMVFKRFWYKIKGVFVSDSKAVAPAAEASLEEAAFDEE